MATLRGARRVEVRLGEALGRPAQPRLDDELLQLVQRDLLQAHEHRRVAVEVRGREEDGGVVGEQRLLRPEMLDPNAQDGARRGTLAERRGGRVAQRALPDEALPLHPPGRMPPRRPLARLRQRERDPAHVIPAGHGAQRSSRKLFAAAVIRRVAGGWRATRRPEGAPGTRQRSTQMSILRTARTITAATLAIAAVGVAASPAGATLHSPAGSYRSEERRVGREG